MIGKLIFATLLTAGMLVTGPLGLRAQPSQTAAVTPARISYINGDVSFWRPGAAEWTPARVNTPLAPGDSLFTGPNGNVEVQIGPRAFVRAAEGTQIGLDNQDPGFVQFRVTAGRASLDLGALAQAQTVELDTPNAAFTIERPGYYHADVTEDSTTFQTQRGGSATMTPAGGVAGTVAASQQVVVTGTDADAGGRGPGARSHGMGQLELPAHRRARRHAERALRRAGCLRHAGARPPRELAHGRELRLRVGPAHRRDGLDALQHRAVDLGPELRLDLARRRAVGLGALSLRPLGPRQRRLGLGAGTHRQAARVRPRPRGLSRRPRACERRPAARMGATRLGRAHHSVVGPPGPRRPPVVGWLGRAARRQQRRRQEHHGRQRARTSRSIGT